MSKERGRTSSSRAAVENLDNAYAVSIIQTASSYSDGTDSQVNSWRFGYKDSINPHKFNYQRQWL